MRIHVRLLPIAIGFFLIQCKSKENSPQPDGPSLPAITQEGLNTIGMRVDGEVWLPNGMGGYPGLTGYYGHHVVSITSNNFVVATGENRQLSLFRSGIIRAPQDYSLQRSSNPVVSCKFSRGIPREEYLIEPPLTGTLHLVRLDSVQRIIAGTFEFDAVGATSGKTIHVTDGRFDLHY